MVTIVPKEAYEKLNKGVSEEENSKSGFSMKDFQKDIVHFSMVNDYMKTKDVDFVGEGSGRIAFMLPKGSSEDAKDSAVCLKVAKNIKGIAQNKGEKKMLDRFKGEACVPRLFAYDKNQDIAIEMELGRKVTEHEIYKFFDDWSRFVNRLPFDGFTEHSLTNINDSRDIYGALRMVRKIQRQGNDGKPRVKAILEDFRKIASAHKKYAPFVSLFEVMFEKEAVYDIPLGDFGDIDNWAFVNRDGIDVLLPIDWGLTSEVLMQYYMD